MSSISSGVDLTTKYQRLAVEYVKVRNQVAVLKSALVEEQSKRADLGKEMAQRETKLFKLEGERDSLLFRNEQLLKRVEGLQESMDAQQATFGMAKGKKKHREANLRLVAESSRIHRQTLGGPSSDPLSVLEGELERKINENSELHSKLFDVERRFDETVTAFTRRIDELEKENDALKIAVSIPFDAKQRKEFDELENDAPGQTLQQTEANSEEKSVPSAVVPKTDSADDLLGCSYAFANESADLCSRKPSTIAKDETAAEKYSTERIATLGESLRHAKGRATYYKQECEELLRKAICDQQRVEALEQNICELTSKCHSLNDALETTQINYEAQFRDLHEHLAENEAKMTGRSDRTFALNGTERSIENGGEKTTNCKKSEKVRSHWFSSSKQSKE
ncbi:hypothetical protein niasHT_037056 [Heterodera trifolii]|uniref:Protein phosphatase 1 regulatory subunit 21 N-terminal domain-containing protein n=1 Tax=Heterodera trifolii TaxID=157864 RepID=A0ABD2J074_9BILA